MSLKRTTRSTVLSPLLLGGLVTALGVASGLWWGAAAGRAATVHAAAAWSTFAATFGLVAAGLARAAGGDRPPGVHAWIAWPVLCVLLGGFAAAAPAGWSLGHTCLQQLRSGASVGVSGSVRVPPGPGSRPLRLRLTDATVIHDGRRCRTGSVDVQVASPDPPGPGDRLGVRGAWRAYPGTRGPRLPERLGYVRGTVIALQSRSPARLGARVRDRFLGARAAAGRRLDGRLPSDVSPIARALVLGDRSSLSPEIRQRFADAGLVHLLAISGFHIGLIAGGIVWSLRRAGRRRRHALAFAIIALYVGWIGAPASAVRAAAMFGAWSWARARGAPARLADVGGLALLASLLIDPTRLIDVGFQLSFAGITGVVAGGLASRSLAARAELWVRGRLGSTAGRASRVAVVTLASSVGATAFTLPIAAIHFGRIAPAAALSSPPGALLVSLAIPAVLVVAVAPGPLAAWMAGAVTLLLRGLDGWARTVAALPLHASVPGFDAVVVLACGLLIVGVWWNWRTRRYVSLWALGVASAVAWAQPAWRALAAGDRPLVCTLDVGQGDAAVVRTGQGRWIVIDAGPGLGFLESGRRRGRSAFYDVRYGDQGRATLVPFLRRLGAREVELFALSHPHLDHFGGAAAVLDAFRVRRVLDPGYAEPSRAYAQFLRRAVAEPARWIRATAGMRLRLDDVELTVLWPPRDALPGGANEHSLAVRLSVGGLAYLNTGDAGVEVERRLLHRWPRDSLRADVLKLGHHGSRTSSSWAWLETTRPGWAVISAGRENTHGHPHPEVLARLDSLSRTRVWRTDLEGHLCLSPGPSGKWVEVANRPRLTGRILPA